MKILLRLKIILTGNTFPIKKSFEYKNSLIPLTGFIEFVIIRCTK